MPDLDPAGLASDILDQARTIRILREHVSQQDLTIGAQAARIGELEAQLEVKSVAKALTADKKLATAKSTGPSRVVGSAQVKAPSPPAPEGSHA